MMMSRALFTVILLLYYGNISEEKQDVKECIPTEYDFIIVGAGSAGSAVASRLAEDSSLQVLLLEAGERPTEDLEIPLLAEKLWVSKKTDWGLKTIPQKDACQSLINQQYPYPRGKMLGGSSGVNAMVYTRCNRHDYDNWAALGNNGWNYEEIFPYFLKLEDYRVPHSVYDAKYHAKDGPNIVQRPPYQSRLSNIFLEAGSELGYYEVDYNAATQTGFMNPVFTIRNGTRFSTYKAYLKPAENKKNLHITTRAHVTKILTKGNQAVGVQFEKDESTWTVKARKEVIISAGSVHSPHLLLLSGIGPKETLEEFNIPVVADLPGVGENLQDHTLVWGLLFASNEKVSIDFEKDLTEQVYQQYHSKHIGPLTVPVGVAGISFVNTKYADKDVDYPDMEIVLCGNRSMLFPSSPEVIHAITEFAGNDDTFFAIPVLLRPKSRGLITLQSEDPQDPPLIDPRYLSHPDDVKVMVEGIKILYQIMRTEAFQKIGTRPTLGILPGCENMIPESDEELACIAKHLTGGLFHPVGTCKMGPKTDPLAVVDPRLRVYGVSNLRVVDASIMPVITTGHTNVPTIMIGEKAADMIKEDWNLNEHEEL